ncbi:sulfatase-like hydrolase/transferase [Phototrophicus methaneseepsis]|uniref:Sulfatase-like hydrolase/transferase n=1 Tax=Phototrophicus methaneseepsis TaxID=2710758 RepID=A0A7S8EBX8_9CHLR|nr:sulfatase-like hydrolase/transferase [Phototrophicus methaneseepsis]QPC84019.1 sulfatase-like hydrolase/transferase [Phototrophicus methaneseepsis]
MSDRPNILIFNPDQWRGDVMGHMGNPAAVTPHLDAFAEQDAVSFRHAFCQNPVCTPSRCSFMTGWYPHVRGHRTMFHMLHPDEPVLLKILKDNGYFVWWGGKNDLVPAQNGFDAYCDVKYKPQRPLAPNLHSIDTWRGAPDGDNYYSFFAGKLETGADDVYYDSDWAMVDGAVEQIKQAPADQPLCIYLPLSYPHPPYGVEDPWFSMIERDQLPPRIPAPDDWSPFPQILAGIAEGQHLQGWTEKRWDELRATYYGMCARVDAQFGKVISALKEANLYDDTAIFFFSDHGDFTGDYGLVEKTQNTFQDCLTNVPFLIKPPANVASKPRISDALVELVDFSATVFDLLSIDPGYDSFGRSLLPLIVGEQDEHRDAVFCEGGRIYGEEQAMEQQSAAFYDPAALYYPRVSIQGREDGTHSKAAMCRTSDYKYVRRLYEQDELYDLRYDPAEQHNLINDETYWDVLLSMQDRLLTWYQETTDVVPQKTDER